MSFRDNLQYLRTTHNMTQEQLAMLLGVSRQSVSKWEAERAYPEMDKLIKMCALFDCSLDELVQGNVVDRPVSEAACVPEGVPPQDITGYDEAMCSFALKVPLAVAVPLGSIAVANAMTVATSFSFGDDLLGAAAVLVLVGLGAGIALAISAWLSLRAFHVAHPFVEDFYTFEQKEQARAAQKTGIFGALCLAIVGCVVSFLLQSAPWMASAACIACFAAAFFFFLRGWLLARRCNVARYNEKSLYYLDESAIDALDDELLQVRAHRLRRERSGYILVMSIATAVGLVMMFIPLRAVQSMFPLAWLVGILACVAMRAARTMKTH